ncbi:hypothetical protein X740_04440 [Mesorhizobium sp. LNHC221B00]|nr:hypothetical protein [Mesorhizobium sp. LNHC221B00]ESY82451.1 hypothetical protein X740_04440 [Mesorhizobium sp. LNHC221B00]
MLGFSLFLRLGMILGFAGGGSAASPDGVFDFSKPKNSGLLILLEDI